MNLTKTDFIQYQNCSKAFWLLKNDPDNYPYGEFSAFLQKITREGYEVEQYVRQLLEAGDKRKIDFQRVFESDDGLFARVDAFELAADGRSILYEVKSSTSVKTDASHNHLKDACFQLICVQRAGQSIDVVNLVHLNADYVRNGEIDPASLLTIVDVTDRVREIEVETATEIDWALELLVQADLDRKGCECLYKSRAHHCDTFEYFNPEVPSPSIYSLPRLSPKRRSKLVNDRIFNLLEIPDDSELTATQLTVVAAARAGAPIIDLKAIGDFLAECEYPLHFLDYETYASAIPLINQTRPHRHFPVQYSLHVLHADGSLEHSEYLEREARLPDRLFSKLSSEIGQEGSIVSWHASFEKARNREMAELMPEFANLLFDLNQRTKDLEDPFKSAYVDARFDGSTSIKKVLPVVCPELSYQELDVRDGAAAMDAWEKMVSSDAYEADRVADALLSYCRLDTYAMVEIFRFLERLAKA